MGAGAGVVWSRVGIFVCEATAKIVTARRGGIQAESAAYDDPERRFIQLQSPHRPRLSPLATIARHMARGLRDSST